MIRLLLKFAPALFVVLVIPLALAIIGATLPHLLLPLIAILIMVGILFLLPKPKG